MARIPGHDISSCGARPYIWTDPRNLIKYQSSDRIPEICANTEIGNQVGRISGQSLLTLVKLFQRECYTWIGTLVCLTFWIPICRGTAVTCRGILNRKFYSLWASRLFTSKKGIIDLHLELFSSIQYFYDQSNIPLGCQG